jgi:hypothetical protein
MGGSKKTVASAVVATAGGVLLTLLSLGPATAQSTLATVSITPQTQSATVGDSVKVAIRAEGVTHLGAYEVMIQYDPDILEFQGFSDRGFLGSTGRQVSCPGPVVEAEAGFVQAGCGTPGSLDGIAGPDGDGELAEFTFQALAAGTSDLVFLKVELANEEGSGCCGEFWIDDDPEGELVINEAAVAIGATSAPSNPDPPAPDSARRHQRTPSGAQNPPFETLPDSSGSETSSGGTNAGSAGTAGGSATGGSSAGASARGATGGSSAGSSAGDAASGDFPVAGYGGARQEHRPWVLTMAYALAVSGLVLTGGAIAFEEWKRSRRSG